MTNNQFSSGLESGNFVVNSDLVHHAWCAIEQQRQINPNAEPSLYNEIIQPENPIVIAFGTPLGHLRGQEGLISSSTLKENNFTDFEFLCNKSNPSFSINLAAFNLFKSHYDELLLLKDKLVENSKSKTPSLVFITGQSMGGSVATLFTLWLLNDLNLRRTRRPLCITFGSPLVGDEHLVKCLLQSWKSCFLHVASNQDPTPTVFFSQNTSGAYKPFGTFLLCSASGCACFDDSYLFLEQLVSINSQTFQSKDLNLGKQLFYFGKILKDLKHKALCVDASKSDEQEQDPLEAGVTATLVAIGVLSTQQEPSTEIKHLIRRMVKHEMNLWIQKPHLFHFRDMGVYMAAMEWYVKDAKRNKIGYYDMYKKQGPTIDSDISEFKKEYSNLWENKVRERENKPSLEKEDASKEEDASENTRWILDGTNYRRMIEPLHIADYYRNNGAKNYITEERSRHFKMLEQWLKEESKDECSQSTAKAKREMAASRLNEDSCFWAHVEEALISCDVLEDEESSIQEKESSKHKLTDFEVYVDYAIKNYAASPDIYLDGSSFIQWWKRYEAIMGSSYCSRLMLKFWEGMHEKHVT